LTLRDSGGDGIYLGRTSERAYNENVVIRDVVCDNNYRQGLSVISARNLLVENSAFNNTSGHGPSAGIDLEPNQPDEEMTNVVIRNCVFLDNYNLGMHVWMGHMEADSEPIDVLWEGNYVRGSRAGIHVNAVPRGGSSGEIVYRNNVIEDSEYAGIFIRRKGVDSVHLVFENNLLYNTARKDGNLFGAPAAPVVLHAQSGSAGSYDRQGGATFRNVHVFNEDLRDLPVLRVTGTEGFEAWDDVDGRITASVLSGKVVKEIDAPLGDNFTLEVGPEAGR